ncbi:hypothetical protein Patl1_27034 [Pistacia atlantica]|uniref:Uncharacterized protein n=1 Tax=Pistacia atlantica TaxID=434234 RepID=A0ACC1AZK7_9ROSI|nr:hypothetical protein Patl1_27034 [Pistacia atlantica]
MKTRRGITKCIDLKSFHDPMKGYLINDTCVFGAEVFVVKCVSKGECLSMIKEPARCYHLWKIVKFSNLLDETYRSKPFGDYNWYIYTSDMEWLLFSLCHMNHFLSLIIF